MIDATTESIALLGHPGHDCMSAFGTHLIGVVERLVDSLHSRWLRQTVAEIVGASDFDDLDFVLGNLVLQPKLAQFDMSDFAKTPPARDSLRGARISTYRDCAGNSEITQHAPNAHCGGRAFDKAVVFCLT